MMIISYHAKLRLEERGIDVAHVREAMQGKRQAHRDDASKSVFHGPKQANGKHVFVVCGRNDKVVTAYWLG